MVAMDIQLFSWVEMYFVHSEALYNVCHQRENMKYFVEILHFLPQPIHINAPI